MSAKVMGLVFEADLPRAEKFILLALADHAKEDGSDVYPSVARIQWKTGYSERQIRSLIDSLERMGILQIVHPGGSGPADVRKYKIVISKIPMMVDFHTWKESKGAAIAPLNPDARVQFSQPKGAVSDEKGCNLEHKKGAAIAPEPRTITVLNPHGSQREENQTKDQNLIDLSPEDSGRALADLLGVAGYAKMAAMDAIGTYKRRKPDARYVDIPVIIRDMWKKYQQKPIRSKMSLKSFLNELGTFVDAESEPQQAVLIPPQKGMTPSVDDFLKAQEERRNKARAERLVQQ